MDTQVYGKGQPVGQPSKKRKFAPEGGFKPDAKTSSRGDLRTNPLLCTLMGVRTFYDPTMPKKVLICSKDWLYQFYGKKENTVTRSLQILGVPRRFAYLNQLPGMRKGQAMGVLTVEGVLFVLEAIKRLSRPEDGWPGHAAADTRIRDEFLPELERMADKYDPSKEEDEAVIVLAPIAKKPKSAPWEEKVEMPQQKRPTKPSSRVVAQWTYQPPPPHPVFPRLQPQQQQQVVPQQQQPYQPVFAQQQVVPQQQQPYQPMVAQQQPMVAQQQQQQPYPSAYPQQSYQQSAVAQYYPVPASQPMTQQQQQQPRQPTIPMQFQQQQSYQPMQLQPLLFEPALKKVASWEYVPRSPMDPMMDFRMNDLIDVATDGFATALV